MSALPSKDSKAIKEAQKLQDEYELQRFGVVLEVWRIHPNFSKDYAEIEAHNGNHFVLHHAYAKKMMKVNLGKYIARQQYKVVNDTWLAKVVHELVDITRPDEPSIYLADKMYKQLVSSGTLKTF